MDFAAWVDVFGVRIIADASTGGCTTP